ncbi:hypothetical protein [Rubrivivax rivuli]|uniref:Uncharacterized protein n=1 Tax=Rubrivivax rivuli TaxID=1862385 RepID=A0A437RRV7_9BURK|nr:hypothetical protein [Rubrivivax rivuli]RVU49527.1 hypothetical protein EOE66_02870 [Rubrivivax rivuli]
MQYQIACGETLVQLEQNVQRLLAAGWMPCGGVAVLPGPMLAQGVWRITPIAPPGGSQELSWVAPPTTQR